MGKVSFAHGKTALAPSNSSSAFRMSARIPTIDSSPTSIWVTLSRPRAH